MPPEGLKSVCLLTAGGLHAPPLANCQPHVACSAHNSVSTSISDTRTSILSPPNSTVHKFLRMGSFAKPKKYDRKFPSDFIVDANQKFKIAHIDDKHEWVGEDTWGKIHDWAKTKTKTNSVTRGDRVESKLYQPITDKYEIRVLEIKPGKTSDQLKGALHHCSVEFTIDDIEPQRLAFFMNDLTVPVSYTALSYTWGEPKFDAKFECDGYVKMITRSLESALRHFRQEDRAVVLWVDQICIDQENNEEKGQQLPLMSRIYELAVNTAIWLGDAADDSDTAMRLLKDVHIRLQFSTEEIIDPTELERRNLPNQDSDDWKALWKLLSRPWFERLWIIQELTLSWQSWVVCGKSVITWESLCVACLQLAETGISQWLTQKYPTSAVAGDCRDLCRHASDLSNIQLSFGRMKHPLLILMGLSRRARCTEPRDKVYGMLGICSPYDIPKVRVDYSDRYHVTQLFQDIVEHAITSFNPGQILRHVDHDSVDLPSWVPDWRMPRRTTVLGSSHTSYRADGILKLRWSKGKVVSKIYSRSLGWKELQVTGLPFDTLETLSGAFEDPDLSPTAENETLQIILEFVANLKDYPSPNTDFSAFWQTLVAGMDERRMLKCPDSFAEIFSYILDLTTGNKGSMSGQTYTRRQTLPKGRGGLDEDKLRSRKPRSAGDTFQRVRTAMIHATKNRRLGGTANGYIGLFPEHSQAGDGVFILAGCHTPHILRPRGDEKFKLVGECYVHGIMGGEAIGPNPDLQDVILA